MNKLVKVSLCYIWLILTIVGCNNQNEQSLAKTITTTPTPTPQVTTTPISDSTPSPDVSSSTIDSYEDALFYAELAVGITKTANMKDDFILARDNWQEAINLLKSVPKTSNNYEEAQKKLVEYNQALNYVQKAISLNVNNSISSESSPPSPKKNVQQKSATAKPQLSRQEALEEYITYILDRTTEDDTSLYVFWCERTKILASTLYNPYEYEILDVYAYNGTPDKEYGLIGSAKVRIKSTNKGGIPIINTWDFSLATQQKDTEYNNKEDYCIANLSE